MRVVIRGYGFGWFGIGSNDGFGSLVLRLAVTCFGAGFIGLFTFVSIAVALGVAAGGLAFVAVMSATASTPAATAAAAAAVFRLLAVIARGRACGFGVVGHFGFGAAGSKVFLGFVLEGRINPDRGRSDDTARRDLAVMGAFDAVLGALHVAQCRHHENGDAIGLFEGEQAVALFIEEIGGDFAGAGHREVLRPLQQPVLDGADDAKGAGGNRAHHAAAFAVRAGAEGAFDEARPEALPRHFQKAEMADAAHLDAGAVMLQGFLDAALNRPVVAVLLHVDEVDDDQSGKVAQAQLPRNLVGGFEVGLEGRVLDRVFARRLARVDVDGDQRFRLVDHQIAARRQGDSRREQRVEMGFDLEAREQRLVVSIELHVLGVGRHEHFHEVLGLAIGLIALDDHLVHVLGVEVADRTLDEVAFLIDKAGRLRLQCQVAHAFPEAQQVIEVALDLGPGALGAGGPDDQAHALRHFHVARHFLEAAAVTGVGDLAGNTTATGGVGHQHAIAPGQRHVGGECRALVAAFFLHDLHQQDLAALDDFLDLVVAAARLATLAATGNFFQCVLGTNRINLLGLGVFLDGDKFAGRGGGAVALCGGSVGCRGFAFLRAFGCGCFRAYGRQGFGIKRPDFGLLCGGSILGRGFECFRGGIFLLTVVLVIAIAASVAAIAVIVTGLAVVFIIVLGCGRGFFLFLFLDEGQAVGNRDLVIIRMDFREGQEAVAVAAIFNEGCLERRLHAGYLGEIDVALEGFAGRAFEIEFFNAASAGHHDAGFLALAGIDEHLAAHGRYSFVRQAHAQ